LPTSFPAALIGGPVTGADTPLMDTLNEPVGAAVLRTQHTVCTPPAVCTAPMGIEGMLTTTANSVNKGNSPTGQGLTETPAAEAK